MRKLLTVLQVGMGPLGQMMTPRIAERSDMRLAGAVDIDPSKAGTDVGQLCGIGPVGVRIGPDLESTLAQTAPDVAVVTTVSSLVAILPVLGRIVRQGVNVVSTCEELCYPWKTFPEQSADLDRLAKVHGVSVLGTGINPGYLMDFLPSALTGVCRYVTAMRIDRFQDASYRRLPFIRKIGAGLKAEDFRELATQGKIRHVGLTESMHMVAAALGWDLERTEDTVSPVTATTDMSGPDWSVKSGAAAGVEQIGRGFRDGREVLTLRFRAAVGLCDPLERIQVEGTPSFEMRIPGGINGDVATCSVVAHAIPVVFAASPGLRTMIDIPPVTCRS